MKVFVRLGLHSEYHGYDIFRGVAKSLEEAIDAEAFELAAWGDKVGSVMLTHDDGEDVKHTHVVFYIKESGEPTVAELEAALRLYDEHDFYDYGYYIIKSIAIYEHEI